MPVRDIRTRLSIEGEKALKQELQAAAREMRVLETGMKAAGAGFDAAGDDMGKLEATSRGLNAQLEQQKEIVKSLTQAVKDSANVYGDASEETDGWKIQLNNALRKQENLRKAIADTDREMEELARDSVRAGRQLESGLGESAEDVTRDLRSMYNELKSGMDDIKGSVGFSAFSDAWQMGSGIVSGLDSFAEETREYRRQMAFLKQNAEMAGLDFQAIKDQYLEMASLTGDEDGAFEGLNNLIASGFDMTEIITAIDELGGAVIRFPETLKFESLADGLQETIATRQAAGQYAELLERLGVDIDDFNTAMAAAKTEEEAQQVALSYLANHGLKETKEGFEATNEALIKGEEATIKLNDALAGFGDVVDWIIAPAKEKIADTVYVLNDFLSGAEKVADMEREAYLEETRKKTGGVVGTDDDKEIFKFDEAENALDNIWNGLSFENLFGDPRLNDEAKNKGQAVGKEYAAAAQSGIQEALQGEKNSGMGDWLAAGAEWIDQLFGWGDTTTAKDKAAEATTEVTSVIQDQINADSPALQSTAFEAGELMMMQMSAGVNAGAAVMLSQLQTAMQSAAGMVSAPIGSGAGFVDAGSNKGLQMGEAVINLDGKQVGNALLPYVNQGMGTALRTAEVY